MVRVATLPSPLPSHPPRPPLLQSIVYVALTLLISRVQRKRTVSLHRAKFAVNPSDIPNEHQSYDESCYIIVHFLRLLYKQLVKYSENSVKYRRIFLLLFLSFYTEKNLLNLTFF